MAEEKQMNYMFTTEEIAKVTGGVLRGGNVGVNGVSTDTRTIEKGCLFVAVRGERFDGNDFIPAAAEKGAAAALSDIFEEVVHVNIPVICVRDTRAAQLKLARYHRDKFGVKLCGVTGSVGKTSTKDMIYAVLSAKYKTLRTQGNFNNDIGLPRTLFGLNESYGAAVIEMGMSALGEISALSQAAHPDCAVITNIGWCHIENLKTRRNILRAKLEILDGASEDAPLILCGDDEYLREVNEKMTGGRRIIRYGMGDGCDVRAENVVHTENGESFDIIADGKRYAAAVPVMGEHHVLNALAAFAVGREFGMSAEEIVPALMDYEASGMRQRIEKRGGVTVILDCYNASPTSMKTSLSVLGGMKCTGRKIAVLGDMLELGEMSHKLHAGTADAVCENADECFLYGHEMAYCRDELEKRGFTVFHSEDKAALARTLRSHIKDGDILLFKGSRGMKMEEIAETIQ